MHPMHPLTTAAHDADMLDDAVAATFAAGAVLGQLAHDADMLDRCQVGARPDDSPSRSLPVAGEPVWT